MAADDEIEALGVDEAVELQFAEAAVIELDYEAGAVLAPAWLAAAAVGWVIGRVVGPPDEPGDGLDAGTVMHGQN